jgi:predicted Fe-S protein YdhL (DUF1289 family)
MLRPRTILPARARPLNPYAPMRSHPFCRGCRGQVARESECWRRMHPALRRAIPEPCRGRQSRLLCAQPQGPRSRLTASAQPGNASCSLAERARLGSSACVSPAAQSQQDRPAARRPRWARSIHALSLARRSRWRGSHPPVRPVALRLARCGYSASRILPALEITPREAVMMTILWRALVDPCSPMRAQHLTPERLLGFAGAFRRAVLPGRPPSDRRGQIAVRCALFVGCITLYGHLATGLRYKHGATRAAGDWSRHRLEPPPCRAHARHVSSLFAAKEARCMGESSTGKRSQSKARQQRLAAQLRANLAKRKAQARARAAGRASVHQVADNSNERGR